MNGQCFLVNLPRNKKLNLCRHSFQSVFGIGHYTVSSMRDQYLNDSVLQFIPDHGLVEEKSNYSRSKDEAYKNIDRFFDELKKEGDVYASR